MLAQAPVLRGYAETMYRAKSWSKLTARLCPHRGHALTPP